MLFYVELVVDFWFEADVEAIVLCYVVMCCLVLCNVEVEVEVKVEADGMLCYVMLGRC